MRRHLPGGLAADPSILKGSRARPERTDPGSDPPVNGLPPGSQAVSACPLLLGVGASGEDLYSESGTAPVRAPTPAMTVNYLSGEFSAWLGELARRTTDPRDAARVAELRVLSEGCAPSDLARVVPGVLDAIDDLCWASLSIGDVVNFFQGTAVARGFGEFVIAAGLLADADDQCTGSPA